MATFFQPQIAAENSKDDILSHIIQTHTVLARSALASQLGSWC